MNPVLILTYNNLELTKQCVDSVQAQDIPVEILAFDNGSTDGTSAWLPDNTDQNANFFAHRSAFNLGVSKGWNWGLNYYFTTRDVDHVLVLNSDVILPSWYYRCLLTYDIPFVTGVGVDKLDQIREQTELMPLVPHPDFSAFLICREAWEKIGPFDERMVSWASDCDYHVRGYRLGVPMMKANVRHFHYGGSTMKTAAPEEGRKFGDQANADRAVFRGKYGCIPGDAGYKRLFGQGLPSFVTRC